MEERFIKHKHIKTMSKSNNRTVTQRSDGTWANLKNGNEKASSLHSTQAQAIQAATQMLHNSGGGELTTMAANQNGARIRSKDTISPGSESGIRDTEH
jgi:hypothetical protein